MVFYILSIRGKLAKITELIQQNFLLRKQNSNADTFVMGPSKLILPPEKKGGVLKMRSKVEHVMHVENLNVMWCVKNLIVFNSAK